MEKKQPTADCIVARLVPSWGSIISLLFKTTEPYEHYYDEHGEEVPYGAIASWTDVELPPEGEDEKIKKTAIKILKGVAYRVFEHEGVSKESVLAYLEKQEEQPASGSSEKPNNHKEWSEDEKKIASIIRLLKTRFDKDTHDEVGFTRDKMCEYLQSLLLRSHWKPSEEQMNYLCAVVDEAKRRHNISVSGYLPARSLESLYNDLKKLM